MKHQPCTSLSAPYRAVSLQPSGVSVRPAMYQLQPQVSNLCHLAFWITRTTRGRRSFAVGACPRCCWAATMSRSAAGAAKWPWKKRGAIAPSCCPWPVSQRKTSPSLPNCKPKREPAGSEPGTPTAAEKHSPQSAQRGTRSEEHTSELQSRQYLVCRLLLEKKKKKK